MVDITVSNKIYIYGLSDSHIKVFKKSLTLQNPVYLTLLRRVKYGYQDHKCLYAVKKEFKYYDYTDGIFSCGRGNLKRVINYCNANNL